MKTLVIHPFDSTTEFLNTIWINKGFTVIKSQVSKSRLKQLIKDHDRIIMLGHGTEDGLIGTDKLNFIIDSKLVYLLREKDCVCIWCNADKFVEKYKLKGIFTGMIISEYEEALIFCVSGSREDIKESNTQFAKTMESIIDGKLTKIEALKLFDSETNKIIKFNKNNIFVIK